MTNGCPAPKTSRDVPIAEDLVAPVARIVGNVPPTGMAMPVVRLVPVWFITNSNPQPIPSKLKSSAVSDFSEWNCLFSRVLISRIGLRVAQWLYTPFEFSALFRSFGPGFSA